MKWGRQKYLESECKQSLTKFSYFFIASSSYSIFYIFIFHVLVVVLEILLWFLFFLFHNFKILVKLKRVRH